MTVPGRYPSPRELAALALVLTLPVVAPAAPPLTMTGTRAFDMARSADDGAVAAAEEGEKVLREITALPGGDREADPLKPLLAEAETSQQALVGYRKQAQASASEALGLLAEVTRLAAATTPDPVRRDVLEQRALLAAHEAAVMAARARTEAERLRAVHAEARALLAGRAARGGSPGLAGAAAPASPRVANPTGREVAVPNLVGARLEAARRDLDAAGLRLGATIGPRDGFVVKQHPEAGAPVPRQTAVSLTLSTTAATTTVVSP